jgi:hypothetical protein
MKTSFKPDQSASQLCYGSRVDASEPHISLQRGGECGHWRWGRRRVVTRQFSAHGAIGRGLHKASSHRPGQHSIAGHAAAPDAAGRPARGRLWAEINPGVSGLLRSTTALQRGITVVARHQRHLGPTVVNTLNPCTEEATS